MMKSRSFWLSLVLLGVFPSVTRGWMDADRSRRLYSDAGRLHQEVLYPSCCAATALVFFVLCSGSPYCENKTNMSLSMYICIKHLLRRTVKQKLLQFWSVLTSFWE